MLSVRLSDKDGNYLTHTQARQKRFERHSKIDPKMGRERKIH